MNLDPRQFILIVDIFAAVKLATKTRPFSLNFGPILVLLCFFRAGTIGDDYSILSVKCFGAMGF